MSILDALSSSLNARTEKPNLQAAARCLAQPGLLKEIAAGLSHDDAALVGDCAEVLTHVAESRPDLIAPFAKQIIPLLDHASTRVRWESMHALANISGVSPRTMKPLLKHLRQKIQSDSSVIVRDHAIKAVGNYAKTSRPAAVSAYPILAEALTVWNGKHAALALQGLANVIAMLPTWSEKIRKIGQRYQESERGVVRKAARALGKMASQKNDDIP